MVLSYMWIYKASRQWTLLEDLLPDLQNEIDVYLQSLTSQALWEIVNAPPLPATWQRQQELLEKNQEETLTAAEMDELEQFRL